MQTPLPRCAISRPFVALVVAFGLCATEHSSIAATATWKVATVHGTDAFSIQDYTGTGDQLLYETQPNTNYHWYENNGAPDGTLATYNDAVRQGRRTFAMTNIAHGASLNSLKLTFEYSPNLTTINFFITDGQGHYGIFAPTSGGVGAATSQTTDLGGGFTQRTLDLTSGNINLTDSTSVAVYEHNGFVDQHDQPYTSLDWSVIKNFTVAGMYDYQRSPEGGWEGWADFFNPVDQQGGGQQINEYGVALIWGSTVDTGAYGSQTRTIRNVQLEVAGTNYEGIFEAGGTAAVSGSSVTVDDASPKVRNWTDDTAGRVLKASFELNTGSSMNFSATAVSDSDPLVTELKGLITQGEFNQAWDFDTNNYSFATGESVTLSVDVGADVPLSQVTLWHYDTAWSQVDLDAKGYTVTLEDGLLSVAGVDEFSAYAIAIPEPGTAILVILAPVIMCWRRRGN